MRRISIFGATGSVGCNGVDLIRRAGGAEAYHVVALTGGRNIARLARMARELRAEIAVTAHEDLLDDLRDGNAVGSLNDTLRSASVAADEVARSVQQLPQLIQRLQATAGRADAVLGAYGDRSTFNNETIGLLRELRRASEAVGSLARLIERNPRAFILGR